MRIILAALPLCLVLASPASAQEARRQLGTHEHGRGFLNIAIEGTRVSIELQAPGSDIAQSETKPDIPEREAAVAAAIATLEKPLELFRLPVEAGCAVSSAKARMTIVGEGEHGHDKPDAHGKDTSGPDHRHNEQVKVDEHTGGEKNAAHGDHELGNDHRGHTDYHGNYELTCAEPTKLATVELLYFKAFPRAERLSIQIIGPKGQTQVEAGTAQPILALGGVN
jgi:hypothetical protein